jgi:peptidoglycan/xylan/chitin deacetylase (PgdA/CDA1 family)
MSCALAAVLLAAALSGDPVQGSSERLSQPASPATREIAVTFDDLPAVSVVKGDTGSLAEFTDRLLANFKRHAVPVVGFVNEGKLNVQGEGLEGKSARTALLWKWLRAGLDLGNHTYSHRSLNDLSIDEFEADVVRGEAATLALLGASQKTLRYFRHPFLHVGLETPKRAAFEAWLKQRGYTVAPVTIDNADYIFAAVYANALRIGEVGLARKIADAYLLHMDSAIAFHEALSQSLFGRPIRQVLLLHANELNADHAGSLFERIRARGYQFVSLARALEDPAFASPDNYAGRAGLSWLHHWEEALGRPRTNSADPPPWVMDLYEKSRR